MSSPEGGLGSERQAKPYSQLRYLRVTRNLFRKRFNVEKGFEPVKEKHPDLYVYVKCIIQSQMIAPAVVITLESQRAALVALNHVRHGAKIEGVGEVLKILNFNEQSPENIGGMIEQLKAEIEDICEKSKQIYEYSQLFKFHVDSGKLVSSHRKEVKERADQDYSFVRSRQKCKIKKEKAMSLEEIDRYFYTYDAKVQRSLLLLGETDMKTYEKLWEDQIEVWGSNGPISQTQKKLFPTVVAWARRSYVNTLIGLARTVVLIDKLSGSLEDSEIKEINKALGFANVKEAEKYIKDQSESAKELRSLCKNVGTKTHLAWELPKEHEEKAN